MSRRSRRPVGNFVDSGAPTARERDPLNEAVRAISDLRNRLKAELTGDVS